MAGEGFRTDGEVLPTLADAIDEQARVLAAAIAPFQAGAVDGMAEAWGWQGKEDRETYLRGAEAMPEQIRQLSDVLVAMAVKLRSSSAATQANERATVDLFGGLLGVLGEEG